MKRCDFPEDAVIAMGRHVFADDIEAALIQRYAGGKPPSLVLVDFRNTNFLELAALTVLTALFSQRQTSGLQTYLGLSRHRNVRDFMTAWRYPEAFLIATGVKITDVIVDDDQAFLGEKQEFYTGKGEALEKLQWDPDWCERSSGKRNFFEFTTFTAEDIAESSFVAKTSMDTPRSESQRWGRPLVQEVLSRHLCGEAPIDDVARVIIYEAMSNAVRHPDARVIQASSRFYQGEDESPKSKSHLMICIWDDGAGIADTLIAVLEKGKPIRTENLPTFLLDRIYCQVKKFGAVEYEHELLIHEAYEVNNVKSPRPGSVLIFSLFPGVSRFAAQETPSTMPPPTPVQPKYVRGYYLEKGMGLYALKKTVVDQFQGKLFIRSGRHFLRIQRAYEPYASRENARYNYVLKVYPDAFPAFKGNLLTISLPLRTSSSE